MEIIELIAFFGISAMVLGVFSVIFLRLSGPKKAKKAGDDGISDLYDVFSTQIKDILKLKDTQINSLTSKLKRMEVETVQDVDEPGGKDVSFEELQALVKQKYPKWSPMLPLFKKQIMEATKGMSLEEILGYVGQITGNKGPTEEPQTESSEFNKNWA